MPAPSVWRPRAKASERVFATWWETRTDPTRGCALGLVAERALAARFGGGHAIGGTRAERYQVLLHIDVEALREDEGTSMSPQAAPVSAETGEGAEAEAREPETARLGAIPPRTAAPPPSSSADRRPGGSRPAATDALEATDALDAEHLANPGDAEGPRAR